MSILVLLIIVLLLFGGGGLGYQTRWRDNGFGGPDVIGILITLIVVIVLLRLLGLF